MSKFKKLFTPIKIGDTEFRNRIFMPPMGTNLAKHDGSVSKAIIEHYTARAKGGAGLIVTEDVTVDTYARYMYNNLCLYDDNFIDGWRNLVNSVHEAGGKIGPQLVHPSFNSRKSLAGVKPVAASPIPSRVYREIPKVLTLEEIEHIIEEFGEAARRAKKAGCDLIQIHAAHNHHLIGSFLSAIHNKRIDKYGGSLENRTRLLIEVITKVREKVGKGFPIIIRISGDEAEEGGRSLQESQFIAPLIVKAGADAINVSYGTSNLFWTGIPPMGTPFAPNANLAEAIKKVVDVPVISVGRIVSPLIAEGILEQGKADAVMVGRAQLCDPDFANKAKDGHEDDIRRCTGCSQCLAQIGLDSAIACMQNADLGREKYMEYNQAEKVKKVLVVGGGMAGMETARVAKLRGHDVTIMEKSSMLGGQVNLAAMPPLRQELTQPVQYLTKKVIDAGVKIELNKEVTEKVIKEFKPDAVVLATGGQPVIPKGIPGIENRNVVTAWNILSGKVMYGFNVAVIGGGLIGSETANFMTHPVDDMSYGATKVTILEMKENICMDDFTPFRHILVTDLKQKGVDIILNATVKKISENSITYEKNGSESTLKGIDTVVLAVGTKKENALEKVLKEMGIETYVIGDANTPRKVTEAVAEGAIAGLKL